MDTFRSPGRAAGGSCAQNTVLGFVLVLSYLGVFPYHLLSLFPLAAAVTLPDAERRFRLVAGAVSFGLLVLGCAQALGVG